MENVKQELINVLLNMSETECRAFIEFLKQRKGSEYEKLS